MNKYDEDDDHVAVVYKNIDDKALCGYTLEADFFDDGELNTGTKLYSEDYVRDLKLQILSLEQRIEDMWREERVRGEYDA
jgi:hypothetical protein